MPSETRRVWVIADEIIAGLSAQRANATNNTQSLHAERIWLRGFLTKLPDFSAIDALGLYEKLDDLHANCEECNGEIAPELCPECFPLADKARLRMRELRAVAYVPESPEGQ